MNFHRICGIALPSRNKDGSPDLLSKYVVVKESQEERGIKSEQKENVTSKAIQ